MIKLVYGVGVSEDGEYKRSCKGEDGKNRKTPEYELWKNMLARCYSPAMNKLRPRYKGCSVSENFKNFQWFAKWCNKQIGFGETGYQLEKDILIKNNKVYSEDTCRFVPNSINMLLAKSNASRGDLPIGVQYFKKIKKYVARVGNVRARDSFGKGHIGVYDTPIEAFQAYKKKKEELISYEANKFRGKISDDLYFALINYEVEITD
jgi:hypothetical protein